jgi:hypothetical protein
MASSAVYSCQAHARLVSLLSSHMQNHSRNPAQQRLLLGYVAPPLSAAAAWAPAGTNHQGAQARMQGPYPSRVPLHVMSARVLLHLHTLATQSPPQRPDRLARLPAKPASLTALLA